MITFHNIPKLLFAIANVLVSPNSDRRIGA